MKTPDNNGKMVKNPTRLQSVLSVAAFVIGTIIGCVSLFVVPPPDEISNSALGLTSEFLLISSAMLGISVSFDYKLSKFRSNVIRNLEDNNIQYEENTDQEA